MSHIFTHDTAMRDAIELPPSHCPVCCRITVQFPVGMEELGRLGRAFAAAHADCQPSARLSKVEEARAEKEGGA